MSKALPIRWRHVFLAGVGVAAVAAATAPAAGDSAASAAPAVADSAAPAAAAASATASASAATPPKPPVIRGADIPVERTPAPKLKEWADARVVSPSREGSRCTLKLLREWLRAECSDEYGGGLFAGSPKDVKVWAAGEMFGWDPVAEAVTHSHLLIETPIERGQSRIFQIVGVDSTGEWGGMFPSEAGALHVEWRAGAADPVVVFTFAR